MSTSIILVFRIFIAKDVDIILFEPRVLFPSLRPLRRYWGVELRHGPIFFLQILDNVSYFENYVLKNCFRVRSIFPK